MFRQQDAPFPGTRDRRPLSPSRPATRAARGAVTREDVERAIRDGIRYLKQAQRDDGSWDDFNPQAKTGTTSLVTLALLTAGEKARFAARSARRWISCAGSGPTSSAAPTPSRFKPWSSRPPSPSATSSGSPPT